MNRSFNLIDEAWIPVVDREGRYREVGLRQVLAEAHEFYRIAAPTGMETASILRLLLALLHRTHDTSSPAAWGERWRQGKFDQAALEDYWRKWSNRFDLFHPERPFYQQATDRKKPVSTATFFPGLAASRHFNHQVQMGEQALTPSEAARNLLVAQAFGLSGGCLPSEKLSHKASTWVAGLVFFVELDNLFQTLACNLLRYDEASPSLNLTQTADDRPAWESDDPYKPRIHPLGYIDYLTWPSRRVWLMPETDHGRTVVRQYVDFVGLPPPAVLDPFKFYRKDEKSKNATGYVPLYLNPNKALWRNSATILQIQRSNLKPPEVLNWLANLRHQGAIRNPRMRLVAYGLVVENQTLVILTRREMIPLPLKYLDQSTNPNDQMDLISYLDQSIKQAEQVADALSISIYRMAEGICPTVGEADKNQVKRISRRLSTIAQYWSSLEELFNRLVLALPDAEDPDLIQERWLMEVIATGRNALDAAEARAGQYPKALKAGVLARSIFEKRLSQSGLLDRKKQGETIDGSSHS